jgi:hypothetical protein
MEDVAAAAAPLLPGSFCCSFLTFVVFFLDCVLRGKKSLLEFSFSVYMDEG